MFCTCNTRDNILQVKELCYSFSASYAPYLYKNAKVKSFSQSTIKVLEKSHTVNQGLLVEAVTKMKNYFAIHHYKREQPQNIEISTLISLDCRLFSCYAHFFPRYKMVVFQAYSKNHWVQNLVIWVEILLLHIITWLYLETRMRIFKALRKWVWMLKFLLCRDFY